MIPYASDSKSSWSVAFAGAVWLICLSPIAWGQSAPEIGSHDRSLQAEISVSQADRRTGEEVSLPAKDEPRYGVGASPVRKNDATEKSLTADGELSQKETEIEFGIGKMRVVRSADGRQWKAQVMVKDQEVQTFVLKEFTEKPGGIVTVITAAGKRIDFYPRGKCTIQETLESAAAGKLSYNGTFALRSLISTQGDRPVALEARLLPEASGLRRSAENPDPAQNRDNNSIQQVYFDHDGAGVLRSSTLVRLMRDGSKVTYVMRSDDGQRSFKVWVAKAKSRWPHKYEFAHKPVMETEKGSGLVTSLNGLDIDGKLVNVIMKDSGLSVEETAG